MDAPVRQWVERVIGGRVTSFESLVGGTARVDAARCETANGARDVVTKVYALGHWFATRAVVEREAAAMQGAATAVPTPGILATTWDPPHGAEVEGNGLLMQRLTGSSRLDHADVVADIPAMAAALAAIHDLPPPHAPTPWPTRRRPTLPDQPIVPRWTRHPDEWAKAFDALAPERPGSAPVFLHGDFHPANVLFDGDGVLTGVVDWSAACVGAPEFDVAGLCATVALIAGIDAADRLLSTYRALTGRELPNQAWFDVLAAVPRSAADRTEHWEPHHPRLTPQLLRPRYESFVFQRYRELTRQE